MRHGLLGRFDHPESFLGSFDVQSMSWLVSLGVRVVLRASKHKKRGLQGWVSLGGCDGCICVVERVSHESNSGIDQIIFCCHHESFPCAASRTL
jgi:hypothetical protein